MTFNSKRGKPHTRRRHLGGPVVEIRIRIKPETARAIGVLASHLNLSSAHVAAEFVETLVRTEDFKHEIAQIVQLPLEGTKPEYATAVMTVKDLAERGYSISQIAAKERKPYAYVAQVLGMQIDAEMINAGEMVI